jgi:hypothetical protein
VTILEGLAFLFLAATAANTLTAETRCPGNVASVPLEIVNGQKILLRVSINHSGPYSFLLDTGSQITLIDLSLAAELHLSVQNSTNVLSSEGSYTSASYAQIDRLEAGSHAVTNQTVLVYDFQKLNVVIHPIRGILGEDFLGRFDMLIDNEHRLLCLDDSATLGANIKGQHIALITSAQSAHSQPPREQLIVSAQIARARRPVRLILDSGSNIPVLYNFSQFMTWFPSAHTSPPVMQVDGTRRAFSVLPRLEVEIGPLDLREVLFVTPLGVETAPGMLEDGLLPTGLFRRVFIDHVNHSAVLERW